MPKGGDSENNPDELWAVISLLHQIGNGILNLEEKVNKRLDSVETSIKDGRDSLNKKIETIKHGMIIMNEEIKKVSQYYTKITVHIGQKQFL